MRAGGSDQSSGQALQTCSVITRDPDEIGIGKLRGYGMKYMCTLAEAYPAPEIVPQLVALFALGLSS